MVLFSLFKISFKIANCSLLFSVSNFQGFDKNSDFLDEDIKKYYTLEGIEKDDFLDFNSNNFSQIISLPLDFLKKE